jgi:hypothetical protein
MGLEEGEEKEGTLYNQTPVDMLRALPGITAKIISMSCRMWIILQSWVI